MLRSMTGFGSGQAAAGDWTATVEIRCVNNRGLKINIKARSGLGAHEKTLRDLVAARLSRGAVDVFVTLTRAAATLDTAVLEAARERVEAVRRLAAGLGIAGELTIGDLLAMPGLFGEAAAPGSLGEAEWGVVAEAAAAALGQVEEMRRVEGRALGGALARLAGPVEEFARAAAELSPASIARSRARLEARLKEWFPNGLVPGDTHALEREAAMIADKADIREELDRLGSHLSQYRDMLAAGGEIGKRLEFLAQEMLREVNTAATKAQDAAVTTLALAAKAAIEQIKEQAANIE